MTWRTNRYFVPPTDIIELEHGLFVMIEIAGMNSEDFNITLLNRTLVVSGVRRREITEYTTYHQLEIGYGSFRVEISLPWHVNGDQVSATYREGFLLVELPRRAETHINVVEIGSDESSQKKVDHEG